MTQVVYYVAASLDGFIAGPNGELDWLHAFETPGNDYGHAQFLAGVDALVMGRSTCETTRSFGDWPYGKRPTWLLTHREASAFAPLPPAVQLSTDSPAQLLAQWQALGRGIALFRPAQRLQPVRWERLSATPQALGVQIMHYKIN